MRSYLPIILLALLSGVVPGCNPANHPTQATLPTSPQSNIACNGLAFYLDPTLGSDTECVTVPENASSDIPSNAVFIYPDHIELTISNYPLSQTQFAPQIRIYPANRFCELLPDVLPRLVSDLKKLIANDPWDGHDLPFLPPIPQRQAFHIHQALLVFNGGEGIRYLTASTEGASPITNKNIIYTIQGLTDDGKYWVTVILPVSNPLLPDNYATLPEGYTQESLILDYNKYVTELINNLEPLAAGSFYPDFTTLDNLIQSITIEASSSR